MNREAYLPVSIYVHVTICDDWSPFSYTPNHSDTMKGHRYIHVPIFLQWSPSNTWVNSERLMKEDLILRIQCMALKANKKPNKWENKKDTHNQDMVHSVR